VEAIRGYTNDALMRKRLELLKAVVSGLSRVAVLYHPTFSGIALAVPETLATAQKLGMTPHLVEIRAPGELVHAFEAMMRVHAEALVVLADPLLLMSARGMAD
jgi:putative tryptophan/tyrosine transport system substrate-binding protein